MQPCPSKLFTFIKYQVKFCLCFLSFTLHLWWNRKHSWVASSASVTIACAYVFSNGKIISTIYSVMCRRSTCICAVQYPQTRSPRTNAEGSRCRKWSILEQFWVPGSRDVGVHRFGCTWHSTSWSKVQQGDWVSTHLQSWWVYLTLHNDIWFGEPPCSTWKVEGLLRNTQNKSPCQLFVNPAKGT